MTIPLIETVPPDYHALYLFYGENDFSFMICVDGTQELFLGARGKATPRTERDCMDWQAETITKIRAELRRIADIGSSTLEI